MRSSFAFAILVLCLAGCQKETPAIIMPTLGSLGPTVGKLIPSGFPMPNQPPRRFLTKAELTPNEAQIVGRLAEFLRSSDDAKRKSLAAAIEALPDYRPARVSDWLHLTEVHRTPEPNELGAVVAHEVEIDVTPTDSNRFRTLRVRIPKGYTPTRPWPIILCFHPTGGGAESIMGPVQGLLGDKVDEFILAGPDDYRPINIDARRCVSAEPVRVLNYLRREIHADADRIYVAGFSQGGYAVWSMTAYFGDQLAGALPVACTFDAAPELPGLWESLLPNVSRTPVLACWGSHDWFAMYGFDLKTQQGTIGENNQRLLKLTQELKLNVSHWRVENGSHTWDVPTEDALALLRRRRERNPKQVTQRFRFLHQGGASWLQGLTWSGPSWGEAVRRFPAKAGESERDALARGIQERLALLEGETNDNQFTIRFSRLGEAALWLHDGLIDWSKPIRVTSQGRLAFEGMAQRDLLLCLEEARTTGDFDRLRWARLRFDEEGRLKK